MQEARSHRASVEPSSTLGDSQFPFVLVDAMYLMKVREDGRVRSRGLLSETRITTDGTREVLGHMLGDSESEEKWGAFFQELKQRGLRGVGLHRL